jgi:hypothetical protein
MRRDLLKRLEKLEAAQIGPQRQHVLSILDGEDSQRPVDAMIARGEAQRDDLFVIIRRFLKPAPEGRAMH